MSFEERAVAPWSLSEMTGCAAITGDDHDFPHPFPPAEKTG
jgi:hypothetical protein